MRDKKVRLSDVKLLIMGYADACYRDRRQPITERAFLPEEVRRDLQVTELAAYHIWELIETELGE